MKVDRNDHLPLYIQLKNIIEEKIKEENWEPGDLIPSEKELQNQFEVSRITVRQAIKELENEGLVKKKQGKGTYVSFPKLSHELPNLTSFTEDIEAKGLNPESKIISIEKLINAEIAEKLRTNPQTVFLNIKRLRLINGEAVGIHDCYLDTNMLDEEAVNEIKEMDNDTSLYDIIEDYNLNISHADETLEGGISDPYISKLLGIKKDFPLLILERITFTENNEAFEFVKMHYRADKYKYSIRLNRN
ncbi:MAG: GntR family transcriptional regulator [Bacillota bacterium]